MADLDKARKFLGGAQLAFKDADALWQNLTKHDLSLARAVLARLQEPGTLIGSVPAGQRDELCRQEALLTSKDPELSAALRHDRALEILEAHFDLDNPKLDGDGETLGVAGGIYKRRWSDLGRLEDLLRAAALYERGARGPMGDDAYPHINAAFLDDLLADAGEEPEIRRARARKLREHILKQLPHSGSWWNAATRAEAFFGLRRYAQATAEISQVKKKPVPWQLETTARQLATLAHLQERQPLEVPEVKAFFQALLPGAAEAIRSVMIGKVGLALSGGGFRASFYHLGVLARLAELDVLRHVEVLSCVSGGSVVGAAYWLALRQRMAGNSASLDRDGYVKIVRELIAQFRDAVATNLRGAAQEGKGKTVWRFLTGEKGAMDGEKIAVALERDFYRKLLPGQGSLYMDDLEFTPADHAAGPTGSEPFNLTRHNWLRASKVPALVLNATTVNTGHAWQFTPTWMGESPWAIHEAADSIPRLQWSRYEKNASTPWRMELGRAVAASACVPFIFEPLAMTKAYDGVDVHLVDGGVYDNQGTVALLAMNCNVLFVSDAAGQLMFEREPATGLGGLPRYGLRTMDTLMERVRQANFADLQARKRSALLRGLMFLHMKAGLDADPIRLPFAQEAYELRRAPLSPSGVRKDFQQAIAELRTDLDAFTPTEANALMACGYQMASHAFERDLARLEELWCQSESETWPFSKMLEEITSTAAGTPERDKLLKELREGAKVRF